jgi:hypothetical protein
MAEVSTYTDRVTAQHSDKPKYMAMVAAVTQCFVNQQNFLGDVPASFDLDVAIGKQLDIVGEWA